MQHKLPILNSKDVIRMLKKFNFVHIRTKGSHYQFKKSNLTVTVPYHKGDLKKETLKSILRQAKISEEDLKNFK